MIDLHFNVGQTLHFVFFCRCLIFPQILTGGWFLSPNTFKLFFFSDVETVLYKGFILEYEENSQYNVFCE